MKATELLKQQHREVEQIFERIEGGEEPLMELVTELADNLAAHMVIEEQLFYPTVKKSADEEGVDLVLESFEEHAMAQIALTRLLATSIDEEPFKARTKVLKELVLHHVEEEEEEMLPKVEKLLNAETLDQLGLQMKELFEDVMAKGHKAVLGNVKAVVKQGEKPRVANGAGKPMAR